MCRVESKYRHEQAMALRSTSGAGIDLRGCAIVARRGVGVLIGLFRFSRPSGTTHFLLLSPGLRPGLNSAVPAGLYGERQSKSHSLAWQLRKGWAGLPLRIFEGNHGRTLGCSRRR
jgi:hypothetical protein